MPRPSVLRTASIGRRRVALAILTGVVTMAAAASAVAVVWMQSPASARQPAPPATPASEAPASRNDAPPANVKSRPAAAEGAPAPRRATAPKAPTDATIAVFSNLRLLTLVGALGTEREVMIRFSSQQMSIVPPDGQAPILTIPYARIERATYVHARAPRWDTAWPAPADQMPELGRKWHWLAVQTPDAYAILRLDGGGWHRVLESFESISGRPVDRQVEK